MLKPSTFTNKNIKTRAISLNKICQSGFPLGKLFLLN